MLPVELRMPKQADRPGSRRHAAGLGRRSGEGMFCSEDEAQAAGWRRTAA